MLALRRQHRLGHADQEDGTEPSFSHTAKVCEDLLISEVESSDLCRHDHALPRVEAIGVLAILDELAHKPAIAAGSDQHSTRRGTERIAYEVGPPDVRPRAARGLDNRGL